MTQKMEEGWISSKDAKNKYREVRGIYTYDSITKVYTLAPHAKVSYYQILLTQGMITIISAAQFELIKQHSWYAKKGRNTWYACTNINGKKVSMHRMLTNFEYAIVDHLNHNGLFNIDENLRDGSNSVNQRNQKDVGGACYVEGSNPYYAGQFYTYNGLHKTKRFYLCDYTTKEEAERAASEWARSNNQRVMEHIDRDGPCPIDQRHVGVTKISNSGYNHISDREKNNGYAVILFRSGKTISKWFSYASRSKESALKDAITFRDEVLAANPPKERKGRPKKQKIE